MPVRSLGQEDPLEEGMAAYSSILAWRIPWTESLAGYSPRGRKESDTAEGTQHTHMHVLLKNSLMSPLQKKSCSVWKIGEMQKRRRALSHHHHQLFFLKYFLSVFFFPCVYFPFHSVDTVYTILHFASPLLLQPISIFPCNDCCCC